MLTAATSTCAQQRLRRAWASAHYRQPANYLRLLLDVHDEIGTRPVYGRIARRALESGSIRQVEEATQSLQAEVTRRQRAIQQVRAAFPLLYRAA